MKVNIFQAVFTAVGGYVGWFLGGCDGLIYALVTLDCLNYVRMLKDLGIGVIFEKENINTLDSKGEVLLTILSSLAHVECVVRIERK